MLKRFFFDDKDGGRRLKLTRILFIAIGFVVVLWASTFLIFLYLPPTGPGTVGDTFGMINTLFSALAFAFLIYASLMQSEELRTQREEIRMTREIHKEQLQTLNSQLEMEKKFSVRRALPIISPTAKCYPIEEKSPFLQKEQMEILLTCKVMKNPIMLYDYTIQDMGLFKRDKSYMDDIYRQDVDDYGMKWTFVEGEEFTLRIRTVFLKSLSHFVVIGFSDMFGNYYTQSIGLRKVMIDPFKMRVHSPVPSTLEEIDKWHPID